ncbi:MAG: amidohydrolase family protein [Planctomycetota bacterium]
MQTSPYQLDLSDRPIREAHAHLLWHGQMLERVDLTDCRSSDELLERLAARARATDGGVYAGCARPEAWTDPDWPALHDLDRVTGDRVCAVWSFDTHTVMVNSAAMRLKGVDRSIPDPPDGVIERDDTGSPTGVFKESAAERFRDLEELDEPTRLRHLELACRDLVDRGFAEVHDLKSQPWLPAALNQLERSGVPMPRLVLYPLVEDLRSFARERGDWETDTITLGGGKIFTDGTLNSRTAWMLEPWADAQEEQLAYPNGVPMWPAEEIARQVRTCEEIGYPIAAHAIGDAAARAVLDAIEAESSRTVLAGPVGRHRVEHCQLVHPDDFKRFGELGVICSMQPCHLLYDIEALGRAVPDRLDRVQPIRSLINAGCAPGELMWFGSDTPVVRPDPGDSLQAAIERRRVGMAETDAIGLSEAIDLETAAACFTMRG